MLRSLGWWVRDYVYAALRQVRAFVDRTTPDAFRSGSRAPIVVLPGVYESWRFLRPLIADLHDRGYPVHVVPAMRHNRRPIADMAASVADYLRENDLTGVVFVAHSKGGLIGKQVMGASGAADRVAGMLAVATPFGGSSYARLMWVSSLRSFSPRNDTIRALARETEVNARIVSVYARFDPHIPEGSELSGAKNIVLATGGHFRILADPRLLDEVEALSKR